MSRELMLAFARPLSLDDIRAKLVGYAFNAKEHGLGELEELHVRSQDGLTLAIIEYRRPQPNGTLEKMLTSMSVDLGIVQLFWVRVVDSAATNRIVEKLADRTDAWVYAPGFSMLFSGREYAKRTRENPSWDYVDQPPDWGNE